MSLDISEMEVVLDQPTNKRHPGLRMSRVLVDGAAVVLRMTVFTDRGGINVMMDDELVAQMRAALQRHEEMQEDRRSLMSTVAASGYKPIERR